MREIRKILCNFLSFSLSHYVTLWTFTIYYVVMPNMGITVRQCHDVEELNRKAAVYIADFAAGCIQEKGYFTLVLSGGNTPRGVYEHLAAAPLRDSLHWRDVNFFWGDERCVPPGHQGSNYSMAEKALLSKVPVPAGNIHRMKGENKLFTDAADMYECEIRDFFRNMKSSSGSFPSFDLILTGVGLDGHTASLFPGDAVLHERSRWVRAVVAPPDMPVRHRITLTLPAINHASHVLFLVSGEEKRNVVRSIINEPDAGERFPSALIKARDETLWFVDFEV